LHKKTFLLFLSVLFLLTGCNKTDSAEHTNADNDRKLSSDVSAETTKSSITTSPENADTPEGGSTPGNSDTTKGGSTPGSTGATENPEETLNNILNELQELDELINGNE
jgi:hypothetical protein